MIVLLILLLSLFFYRGLGFFGVELFATWPAATRYALATMFLFTASAHFTPTKEALIRMVPTWVPWPRTIIYFTGICELAGAIGLLIPALRTMAGVALILFLVAVFPANVRAAQQNIGVGGRRATPLWLRSAMQLLYMGLIWWSALWAPS